MWFILCIMLPSDPTNVYQKKFVIENWVEVEHYNEYSRGFVSRENIREIPKDYLLAMIAIHECINTQPQDAWYIIEASYNRELINHGKYGDIYSQVLSTEFKGLIDQNFYFDPENLKHIMCLDYARRIINGERKSKHVILGWVNFKYDTDSIFLKKVRKRIVSLPDATWHQFWK